MATPLVAIVASPIQSNLINHLPISLQNNFKCRHSSKSLPHPNCFSHPHRLLAFRARTTSPRRQIKVLLSGDGASGRSQSRRTSRPDLDAFLAAAELLFIAPPAIYSVGCLVSLVFDGAPKWFPVPLDNRVFVLQFVLLAGAVAIGVLLRVRQWRRGAFSDEAGTVDLIPRIEKVEEDLRSSTITVRVLSRQLEKLGIRFRIARKALKDPIAETAALSKRNSEATGALALKEDALEKELGEIQKVLLAMQEQQQKQLELILAIAEEAGRVAENDGGVEQQEPSTASDSSVQNPDSEVLQAHKELGREQ